MGGIFFKDFGVVPNPPSPYNQVRESTCSNNDHCLPKSQPTKFNKRF